MVYTKAATLAHEQREIEHVCLFEKGWIHFLKLQYEEALECFTRYTCKGKLLQHFTKGLHDYCHFTIIVVWFRVNFILLVTYVMYQYFLNTLKIFFFRLKNETRWSACFYAYMAAIVTGVKGNLKESRELFLQCSKLVKRKNNNLEKFCSRRVSHMTIT